MQKPLPTCPQLCNPMLSEHNESNFANEREIEGGTKGERLEQGIKRCNDPDLTGIQVPLPAPPREANCKKTTSHTRAPPHHDAEPSGPPRHSTVAATIATSPQAQATDGNKTPTQADPPPRKEVSVRSAHAGREGSVRGGNGLVSLPVASIPHHRKCRATPP